MTTPTAEPSALVLAAFKKLTEAESKAVVSWVVHCTLQGLPANLQRQEVAEG